MSRVITLAESEFLDELSARFEADKLLYDEAYERRIINRAQWMRRLRLIAKEYRLARAEWRWARKQAEYERARLLLAPTPGRIH